MSDRYPNPGWNGPAHPGQQPVGYPQYGPVPGGPADWQPKKKRTGLIVTLVVVVLVLVVGGGVGVWVWQSGGSDGDPSADLPANPDLAETPFPDLTALRVADGPQAMCAALVEKLTPRGYLLVSGKRGGGGQYCRFVTPGASLLTDGSNDILLEINVWQDNVADRYAKFQEQVQTDATENARAYSASKVERFPVGDAGFVSHRENKQTTSTEAFFRSGELMMRIMVGGTVVVADALATTPKREPLAEEVTYREVADVLATLNGAGEPGPRQITTLEQVDSPALAGTAELSFPDDLSQQSACDAVTTLAASWKVKRTGSGQSCKFDPVNNDWRDSVEGNIERNILVVVKDFPPEGNARPEEKLGEDLRFALGYAEKDEKTCPLYRLPFADTGYTMYCGNFFYAGFLLNGRSYVYVEASNTLVVSDGLSHLPEDVVLADLVAMLTAMARK
ncbi:hypothetical protein [Actinophytocola sediminis]